MTKTMETHIISINVFVDDQTPDSHQVLSDGCESRSNSEWRHGCTLSEFLSFIPQLRENAELIRRKDFHVINTLGISQSTPIQIPTALVNPFDTKTQTPPSYTFVTETIRCDRKKAFKTPSACTSDSLGRTKVLN